MLGSFAVMWAVLSRMGFGTRIHAVGGDIKAAHLSAIHTRHSLLTTDVLRALIAALTGLLLTAPVESGDATPGGSNALE